VYINYCTNIITGVIYLAAFISGSFPVRPDPNKCLLWLLQRFL